VGLLSRVSRVREVHCSAKVRRLPSEGEESILLTTIAFRSSCLMRVNQERGYGTQHTEGDEI